MDVLNLKLSEAVSKALTQPTATSPGPANEVLNGRRPIPLGRGRALGDLIISYVALTVFFVPFISILTCVFISWSLLGN